MRNLNVIKSLICVIFLVGVSCTVVGQGERTIKKENNGALKAMTSKIKEVNPAQKTFKIMLNNQEVTVSTAKLKGVPKKGAVIYLKEDPARYFFKTCEKCNQVCPGVCFLEPDYCRCYLLHL